MKKPEIDAQAVVATGAVVLGDVTIKKDASIWYNAVVRGDSSEIQIGEGTNIQDLCVLHVDENCPLAFVVFIENGGSGSAAAAPVAAQVLKACAAEIKK